MAENSRLAGAGRLYLGLPARKHRKSIGLYYASQRASSTEIAWDDTRSFTRAILRSRKRRDSRRYARGVLLARDFIARGLLTAHRDAGAVTRFRIAVAIALIYLLAFEQLQPV